jgi:hypothetical protein
MSMQSLSFAACTAVLCATLGAAPAHGQQTVPPTARPGASTPETPTAMPPGQSRRSERTALPQGFSVVLVLGDIQGVATADDVPPAARKALNDMREFLPFKSYKLLDAAWLMCCGLDPRSGARGGLTTTSSSGSGVSQLLRGPEDQEYELKLVTSRSEASQVFVRFSLFGSSRTADAVAGGNDSRALARRIEDLKDRSAYLQKQIQETKKKVDVGVVSGSEIPKLELELRRVDREIHDLSAHLAEARSGRSVNRATEAPRSPVMDTSFTMGVGETVVVGTSRLKGGSRALIALLTAVPPRTTTTARED